MPCRLRSLELHKSELLACLTDYFSRLVAGCPPCWQPREMPLSTELANDGYSDLGTHLSATKAAPQKPLAKAKKRWQENQRKSVPSQLSDNQLHHMGYLTPAWPIRSCLESSLLPRIFYRHSISQLLRYRELPSLPLPATHSRQFTPSLLFSPLCANVSLSAPIGSAEFCSHLLRTPCRRRCAWLKRRPSPTLFFV